MSALQAAPPVAATTTVAMFELALAMPGDMSLRLDQPCVRDHGSLGGWRRVEGREVTCTLLWRPPAYWSGEAAREGDEDLPETEDLQAQFVDHALARTRRDGLAVEVLAHESETRVGDHPADIIDVSIGVRRRMTRLRLRRRQALWTCPDSGRHLAFEASAIWDHRALVDDAFTEMLATLRCHGGESRHA